MSRRGSGIEPFHFVGIEPFKTVGVEPFVPVGIEPFKKGVRIEPFQTGPKKSAPGSTVVVGGDTSFGAGDAGSAALVADALNSATAAVVRWEDPAVAPIVHGAGETLWQRDDWVRAELAHQALTRRLRVAHNRLWFVPETAADGKTADAGALLELLPPDEAKALPAQLKQVLARKDERPDRASEILVQVAHFWPFWTAITGIDPTRQQRTYELLQIAATLSPAVGQPIKHALNVKRPHMMSVLVQPMIPVPGHAAFPSGHATGAHLFVTVMCKLLKLSDDAPMRTQLLRMAERIADNRVVAGAHYPIDGDAGRLLGQVLGNFFVASCEGAAVQGFLGDGSSGTFKTTETASSVTIPAVEPLKTLWGSARAELGIA